MKFEVDIPDKEYKLFLKFMCHIVNDIEGEGEFESYSKEHKIKEMFLWQDNYANELDLRSNIKITILKKGE